METVSVKHGKILTSVTTGQNVFIKKEILPECLLIRMACNTDKKLLWKLEELIKIESIEENRNFSVVCGYGILKNCKTIIHSTPDQILNEFITGGSVD